MPIGNITPKTDTYERSSMLLGAEEYPSTVQNQLCKNEGYLMYQPRTVHQYFTGTTLLPPAGTQNLNTGFIYLSGGKYDANVRIHATTNTVSYLWLTIGTTLISPVGTVIQATADYVIEESLAGLTMSAGWYDLRCYSYCATGTTNLVTASSVIKQYEEA